MAKKSPAKPAAPSNPAKSKKLSSRMHAGVLAALDDPTSRLRTLFSADGLVSPATICLELRSTYPPYSFEEPISTSTIAFSPSSPAPTVMTILLTVNLASYPFDVLEGSISGDIYTTADTLWRATSGLSVDGVAFNLTFERGPLLTVSGGSTPLNPSASPAGAVSSGGEHQMTISGFSLFTSSSAPNYSPVAGSVYTALYFFDHAETFYPCRILFKGWQD
jgi:hypothetical protein